jgi:protein-disulfide isomerase
MEETLKEPKKTEETKESKKPSLVINFYTWATPIIGLVMLVVGLLGGYFLRPLISTEPTAEPMPEPVSNTSDQPPQDAVPSDEARDELMSFLTEDTRHYRGDPDAAVTIIEFSDFKWPYCGTFAADAGRQIDENYVENGDVRIGYWHFSFLGPQSNLAAEASECAADQDAFWEYHDLLFDSHTGGQKANFTEENLKLMAADLELDTEKFNECFDSGTYKELVQNQTSTAQSLGVGSTPAFLVNGIAIIGAQPFENFQQVIDEELEKLQ